MRGLYDRGKKDNDTAEKILGNCFTALIVCAIALTIIVLLFKEPLLYLFAASGNRLGYGGGYYDRYLSDYCGNVIGLAFSFQEVANLPVEPFDLPIKKIINEK